MHIDVAAYPVLAVAEGEARNAVGSAFAGPAAEHPVGVVTRNHILAVGGVEYINTRYALKEEVEVEALPLCAEVKAESPVGSSVTDVCTVVAGDFAVVVHINEAEVAGNSVGLNHVAVAV